MSHFVFDATPTFIVHFCQNLTVRRMDFCECILLVIMFFVCKNNDMLFFATKNVFDM